VKAKSLLFGSLRGASPNRSPGLFIPFRAHSTDVLEGGCESRLNDVVDATVDERSHEMEAVPDKLGDVPEDGTHGRAGQDLGGAIIAAQESFLKKEGL
jgi:hypothetical protein